MFNAQATPYKEATPDRFLIPTRLPGVFQYTDKPRPMYYVPGGVKILQDEFLGERAEGLTEFAQAQAIVEMKGPLAIYHSGLGGTWSL